MKRVTGIGGVFFNAKDPVALRAWYQRHLGIDVQEWGGSAFAWTDAGGNATKGTTAWSIGAADDGHFAPSKVDLHDQGRTVATASGAVSSMPVGDVGAATAVEGQAR
jgi:hypothetical protein